MARVTATGFNSSDSTRLVIVEDTLVEKTIRFTNVILGSDYSQSHSSIAKLGAGWKILFVQLAMFAMTLSWSLINGASSGTNPLMEIKLSDCNYYGDVPPSISQSAGPISFTLYFQLINGMCVKESMYDTDPSQDCFEWSDSVYWENFGDAINNEYLAQQAHENVGACPLVFYLLMISGIIVSVLELLQKVHNGIYPHLTDETSWLKWSITMTVTFAKLCGAFITFLFGAVVLSLATASGTPHGNQIVIGDNWRKYYGCDDVSTRLLEGASRYNSAIILSSFTFVGFAFGMFALCFNTRPDAGVKCCWTNFQEQRRMRDVEMNRV
jgi:hypothetical protein